MCSVAQRAQFRIVIVRRNEQTVRTGDAFDKNRRDVRGSFHLNHFFDVRNAFTMAGLQLLPERAAVTIRIKHPHNAGNARLDGQTARIARSGHPAHRRSMIRTVARDNFFASRHQLGHLHRVFVGFRAAQRENDLAGPVTSASFLPRSPRGSVAKLGPAKQSSSTCFLMASSIFRMLVSQIQIDQLRTEISQR
jgi:hypothetical protein